MIQISDRVGQLPGYPLAKIPTIKRRLMEAGVDVITEPFVDPYFSANMYLVRGRDADLLPDTAMGIELLTEAQYRALQKLGDAFAMGVHEELTKAGLVDGDAADVIHVGFRDAHAVQLGTEHFNGHGRAWRGGMPLAKGRRSYQPPMDLISPFEWSNCRLASQCQVGRQSWQ